MSAIPEWTRGRVAQLVLIAVIGVALLAAVSGLASPGTIVNKTVVAPIAHAVTSVVPAPYSCSWDGGSGNGVIMAAGLDAAGKQAAQNGYDATCTGVGGKASFDSQGQRVKPLPPDPTWRCTAPGHPVDMQVSDTAAHAAEGADDDAVTYVGYGKLAPKIYTCRKAS